MKSGDYMICSDYDMWKSTMEEELNGATSFDIHCWNEECDVIQLALEYGSIKPFDWSYGKVITGSVTPSFIHWLMELPRPVDRENYDKMTPFFSIFLDTGFSSEHYGTELAKQ